MLSWISSKSRIYSLWNTDHVAFSMDRLVFDSLHLAERTHHTCTHQQTVQCLPNAEWSMVVDHLMTSVRHSKSLPSLPINLLYNKACSKMNRGLASHNIEWKWSSGKSWSTSRVVDFLRSTALSWQTHAADVSLFTDSHIHIFCKSAAKNMPALDAYMYTIIFDEVLVWVDMHCI